MFERFTDRARKVMALANQEAQRFNHEFIGTEHILLGLVKEGSGVGATVLKNLDVDIKKLRLEVEKLVKSGPDMVTMGKLPQTPRAKKVIEYAIEEARETFKVMRQIPSTLNHCNVFILLPGTPLYQFSVEKNLFQMKLTGAHQDAFRAPQMLYGQLCVLDGDVSDSADFAATTQSVEVYEILKKRLADNQTRLTALLEADLAAFNNFLKERSIEKAIDVETP